jgi:hypothetical protein
MTAVHGYRAPGAPAQKAPLRGRAALNARLVESADTSLRRAVLARLIAEPLVSTGHIGVAAVAGLVTLSGYVTSEAQKDAATAAARRVKGVEQVADDVRVAVPSPDLAEPLADDFQARPPRDGEVVDTLIAPRIRRAPQIANKAQT